MTIKRQLFISNIRIIVISFAAILFISSIAVILSFGQVRLAWESTSNFRDSSTYDMRMILWPLVIAIFIILISLFNNFFTNRMTKHIIKPLEPLTEGIRQIQNKNYAYRIKYQRNDEFRPICDVFNEMAAKLEASTERQKKDEANRKELITGISHDLCTPLSSIIGCIEGIETGVASTPEMQKQFHTFIMNEAANMKYIIEQLFLFSKLDMDEFPLNLMRVDITLAISEMIEDSLANYVSRGMSIHLSDMPQNLFVSVDVRLLRNVVINILENSVKYKIKEHGKIDINATVESDSILLRFEDDGPGVEADKLSKLTDVFFRSDPSRSDPGSGLGLAISKKIIQNMRGQLYAELPPSGGLAIVIRLPLLQVETK